jgi:carboxylesterase
MRLIGDYLHQQGCTVSGPLLPGHGTTVEDMNRRRWIEWTGHAEGALAELQARCDTVFVGGLSMGSVLTLYLAALHPELVGAVAYSPAVWPADRRIYLTPALKHLIRVKSKGDGSDLSDPEAKRRLWSYEDNPAFAAHELLKLLRQVRRLLPRITRPVLLVHSTGDTAIHPASARRTFRRIGSPDRDLVTLHNSGHCITVDSEWEVVAAKTWAFIDTHR